uniref:Uncharacterized protein n=1 Tax=Arundo donax TaxID=35708 RepID=A0A0A8ZA65_ARUDO
MKILSQPLATLYVCAFKHLVIVLYVSYLDHADAAFMQAKYFCTQGFKIYSNCMLNRSQVVLDFFVMLCLCYVDDSSILVSNCSVPQVLCNTKII